MVELGVPNEFRVAELRVSREGRSGELRYGVKARALEIGAARPAVGEVELDEQGVAKVEVDIGPELRGRFRGVARPVEVAFEDLLRGPAYVQFQTPGGDLLVVEARLSGGRPFFVIGAGRRVPVRRPVRCATSWPRSTSGGRP